MVKVGLKSEKHKQNRGKLRANKGASEREIRDMTTEKGKNQGRKWLLKENDKYNAENNSNKGRKAKYILC